MDNPENIIEKHILSIQKVVVYITFCGFLLLLSYLLFIATVTNPTQYAQIKEVVNIFLPIITGWIGIIIAFYFSKELSNLLISQIKSFRKKNEVTEQKLENIEKRYKQEKQQAIIESGEIIKDLLKEVNINNESRKRPRK